ncbi:MAG: GspH/FimT family pseudopilin [Sphingopyxis sp.]
MMRTSMAAIHKHPDQLGFTLVELMVVLAILALASTAVILTVRPGEGGADAQAARFAARVAALRDRSVIEGRTLGLWVTASGYGFEQRSDGHWQPFSETRLSPRDWDAGTAVTANGAAQARLAFSRIGLPDHGLRVELTAGGDSASVRVDAAGDVVIE